MSYLRINSWMAVKYTKKKNFACKCGWQRFVCEKVCFSERELDYIRLVLDQTNHLWFTQFTTRLRRFEKYNLVFLCHHRHRMKRVFAEIDFFSRFWKNTWTQSFVCFFNSKSQIDQRYDVATDKHNWNPFRAQSTLKPVI